MNLYLLSSGIKPHHILSRGHFLHLDNSNYHYDNIVISEPSSWLPTFHGPSCPINHLKSPKCAPRSVFLVHDEPRRPLDSLYKHLLWLAAETVTVITLVFLFLVLCFSVNNLARRMGHLGTIIALYWHSGFEANSTAFLPDVFANLYKILMDDALVTEVHSRAEQFSDFDAIFGSSAVNCGPDGFCATRSSAPSTACTPSRSSALSSGICNNSTMKSPLRTPRSLPERTEGSSASSVVPSSPCPPEIEEMLLAFRSEAMVMLQTSNIQQQAVSPPPGSSYPSLTPVGDTVPTIVKHGNVEDLELQAPYSALAKATSLAEVTYETAMSNDQLKLPQAKGLSASADNASHQGPIRSSGKDRTLFSFILLSSSFEDLYAQARQLPAVATNVIAAPSSQTPLLIPTEPSPPLPLQKILPAHDVHLSLSPPKHASEISRTRPRARSQHTCVSSTQSRSSKLSGPPSEGVAALDLLTVSFSPGQFDVDVESTAQGVESLERRATADAPVFRFQLFPPAPAPTRTRQSHGAETEEALAGTKRKNPDTDAGASGKNIGSAPGVRGTHVGAMGGSPELQRAGIRMNDADEHVVPLSFRANGTQRREIKIRPGYRPQDLYAKYCPPALRTRTQSERPVGSAASPGSPASPASPRFPLCFGPRVTPRRMLFDDPPSTVGSAGGSPTWKRQKRDDDTQDAWRARALSPSATPPSTGSPASTADTSGAWRRTSSPLPRAIFVNVHAPMSAAALPRSPVLQERAQAEGGTATKDTRGGAAMGVAPARGPRTSAHVRASTTGTGVLRNTRGRGAAAPSRLPRAAPAAAVGAGVADGGGGGAAGVQARARRGESAGNHLRGQTRVRAGAKASGGRSLGDGAVGAVGGGPGGVGERGVATQRGVVRAAAGGAGMQARARAHEETGEGLAAARRRVKTRSRTVSARA
ncbi:hypothetical protein HETIRDRAFT_332265 [Heterobasidion irregulare TC 32-1]|uniref:WIBG Mago-binding domain-containing protein n=1 Tax=Heterobasidion irregulare (strain TC 32-1) TaxID=747525 RepID=W4JP45_HETIT|nr:uncharacterized protein HETIRDRAFT_332265 [Heterobasidion irregulare TC 32-1]ETW74661.1 hypothetical protein HETIRDRAFT_332265 [Heterobasidion irregulare TC 32-1]